MTIEVVRTLPDLRAARHADGDAVVAFVPTMGNLHAGHLALVRRARASADRVVASIYVNPTQFGPGEDYTAYPRTPDEDLSALEAAGCDRVWMPDDAVMYPFGRQRAVMLRAPADLADTLCGRARPGHFDGVVTVVARLFHQVRPDVAVFGEKDYQQLLIVRRMVEDLSLPVRIEAGGTVREDDGLAMSSRNRYLDPEQRRLAGCLNRRLRAVVEGVRAAPGDWARHAESARTALAGDGLVPEYVAVRRADDLAEPADRPDGPLRVLAAARVGPSRLIDNLPIELPGPVRNEA